MCLKQAEWGYQTCSHHCHLNIAVGGSHDTSGAFLLEKKENVVVRALALSGHPQPEEAHTTYPISHPCDASKLGQCPALLLLN